MTAERYPTPIGIEAIAERWREDRRKRFAIYTEEFRQPKAEGSRGWVITGLLDRQGYLPDSLAAEFLDLRIGLRTGPRAGEWLRLFTELTTGRPPLNLDEVRDATPKGEGGFKGYR